MRRGALLNLRNVLYAQTERLLGVILTHITGCTRMMIEVLSLYSFCIIKPNGYHLSSLNQDSLFVTISKATCCASIVLAFPDFGSLAKDVPPFFGLFKNLNRNPVNRG